MIEIEERHNANSLFRIAQRFKRDKYETLFYDGFRLRAISAYNAQRDKTDQGGPYINNFFFMPDELMGPIN
jgi:hypothetical protein